MKKLGLLCIVLMAVSCQTSHVSDGQIETITIGKNVTASIGVKELFQDVKFVNLAVNEACMMRAPRKIALENDRIFISDGSSIFQYTKDGCYISSLSRKGRGLEEYHDVLDFVVHKDNLFIIDRNMKILKYSINNKWVASAQLDFFPATIFPLNDKELLLTSAYQNDVDKFHIYDTDSFRRLTSFCPINKSELTYRHIMNQTNFFVYDSHIRFYEPMNNLVYNVDSKDISPVYLFDFYGKNPPESFWAQSYANVMECNIAATRERYCFGVPVFAENSSSLLFTYRDAASYLLCRYSKKSKEAQQFEAIEFCKGVPPVKIEDLSFNFLAEDKLAIAIPDYLFFDSNGQIYAQELASIIENNGNPVICVVTLK